MILVKSLIVLFLLLLFIHGFNYVKRKMIDPPPGGRYREGFTGGGNPLRPPFEGMESEEKGDLEGMLPQKGVGGGNPLGVEGGFPLGGGGGNPQGDALLAELMELKKQVSDINKSVMENI